MAGNSVKFPVYSQRTACAVASTKQYHANQRRTRTKTRLVPILHGEDQTEEVTTKSAESTKKAIGSGSWCSLRSLWSGADRRGNHQEHRERKESHWFRIFVLLAFFVVRSRQTKQPQRAQRAQRKPLVQDLCAPCVLCGQNQR